MTPLAELERVLAEDDWLRRIARRLVGDADAADDLVQDAWVAALARGRRGKEARPWLLGVLHNLRRKRARRDADEAARVRVLAEQRLAPSTDEVVLELTLRQRVTEGLLALEEPYRTALFLRYVQDEKLEEIARRTGVAVSTAHERIRRGLELLRRRLDLSYGGDRRAWAALLLPLAEPAGLAVTALGGLVVGTAAKVAVSLVALGGALVFVWSRAERAGVAEHAAAAVPGRETGARSLPQPLAEPASPTEPRATLPGAPDAAPAQAATRAPALLHGRVIDTDGAAVARVPVGFLQPGGADGGATATTDAAGAFSLPAREPGEELLRCLAPDLTTLVHGVESGGERLVVVAPRADFAGTVVDPSGAPLAGAAVAFRLRQSLFRDLGLVRPFEAASTGERAVTTGADGRFAFDGVAGGPHLALEASAPGYGEREVELPRGGDLGLSIVLEPRGQEILIRGLVLDVHGRPVPEALVSAGLEVVTTDQDGTFGLRWKAEGAGHHVRGEDGVWRPEKDTSTLMATKAGHGPALALVADLDLEHPVVLRLAAEPLSLSGTVVDAQDRPRAGVLVWEANPHLFGMRTLTSGSGTAQLRLTLEQTTRGDVPEGALTDGEGRFVLGGLIEGAYNLIAFDPRTALQAGPFSVEAGTSGARLVLPDEPGMVRVAGRVVTASGTPIAGVRIQPMRSLVEFAQTVPPRREDTPLKTSTDAEGRFEFPCLATRGTSLELQHELFFIRWVALEGQTDLEHLELVQPVLCELQLELASDPELADRLEALDEHGERLDIVDSFGVFVSFGATATIEDGKTTVLRVAETARTLVLFKDQVEVLRRPLRLDPAQRTDLRL